MTKEIVSRRQILRGAGGFTLGLPVLPSLLVPRGAHGAEPAFARKPRFVAITTEHGGIKGANMYPDDDALTEASQLFSGHQIRSGRLSRKAAGTEAVLSPVLRAPASLLTDRLVSKMNVLRGFDIPFHLGHHTGGHLGHFSNGSSSPDSDYLRTAPTPTIDQVMAWSPSFYGDLSGTKERSIVFGVRPGFSWGWSNPAARSGAVQAVRYEGSSLTMFNRIFVPTAPAGTNPRKPIVDRVLESYRTLRQSNRRIGTDDRRRLDDHMGRLSELQRRLSVTRSGSCGNVARPTDDTAKTGGVFSGDIARARRRYQLYNDVIVAAFMCGTTRIASYNVWDTFSEFQGDWHQDVAHKHSTTGQPYLTAALTHTFRETFLDLAAKLDVEETPGVTYLDNSLLQWTQEAGVVTHHAAGIPIVTMGSAAGFFRTGLYVDFRNLAPTSGIKTFGPAFEQAGLTYQRWLATALQAMGIPRAELEKNGAQGYGVQGLGSMFKTVYVSGVVETASQVPAILRA